MEAYLYEDLYLLEEKHWWHISKRRLCLAIIKKFSTGKRPTILDVGCGTGKNIEEFNKVGKTYGIDNSSKAIKFCKIRNLKHVRLASSNRTGFKSGFFDVVTLLDVLEHVDEQPTLSELKRILKKSGKIIITVPAYMWLCSNWDKVLHHKRR